MFNFVSGQLRRGVMRFNAENRAFRELEKQKVRPVAAPKHQSNLSRIEQIKKGTTELIFFRYIQINNSTCQYFEISQTKIDCKLLCYRF